MRTAGINPSVTRLLYAIHTFRRNSIEFRAMSSVTQALLTSATNLRPIYPLALLFLGKYPHYSLAWRLGGPQRVLDTMDN